MKKNTDPSYVVINDDKISEQKRRILREHAKPIRFPLSQDILEVVALLERKFDQEKNCAGLAAPQIGFSEPIIIFSAIENNSLKKWRPDFTQYMPKTIWINPKYEAIDDEMHEDYEACFSVYDLGGRVKRHKRIRYSANLIDGTKVHGIAEGYLARIIQHEVDHVQGILFIDKVTDGKVISLSEYMKIRAQEMNADAE